MNKGGTNVGGNIAKTKPFTAPEGFYDNRPISFTHIPKCSGTSFNLTMKPKFIQQNCYRFMAHHPENNNTMNCVFLRSPRPHVQSQFLECKYDEWGQLVTKATKFPRTDDIDVDFKTWLGHFVQLEDSEIGPAVDFNCVDPRNTMTRHLSCVSAPNPEANHALTPPPNLTEAISNVASDAAFVGLTDFFHESICMIKLRRSGSLPTECGCDAVAAAQRNRTLEIHFTHFVPPHLSVFPDNINIMIDKLTKVDRVIFIAALQRFLEDITVAEKVANRPFLCNRTRASRNCSSSIVNVTRLTYSTNNTTISFFGYNLVWLSRTTAMDDFFHCHSIVGHWLV